MKDIIYLDHAATTATDPEVLEAMLPYFSEKYGSATQIYSLGREGGEAVEKARERVAALINADPDEIYFTAGGTESDNWAIFGTANKNIKKGNHVITDKIEHHAVLHSFDELKRRGFDTTIVGVDSEGFVSPAEIEAAVTDKTTLITVMHANNEIGTVQPVKEIAEVAHAHGIHFHTDTVQTVGHIPVDVKEIGCDSLAISAHKFYGPKGIGAFYLKKGSKTDRLLFGGAQEKNRRPGTQNVPGIVGMGFACERAMKNLDKEIAETKRLQTMLIEGIESAIVDCRLNGSRTKRLPGNVNFSFDGVEGESMILFLDMEGICVSSGSACTSGSLDPSHVLMALGLKHEQAHGSLRMTLGKENTEADVKKVLEVLPPIVARLREMSPLYNK